MNRAISLMYGIACYLLFLVVYLYFIGFVGNIVVPRTLDAAPRAPLGWALLTNTALIVLFGAQHSVMARPAFKRAWTRIVPAHLERSTYVLFSNVALFALCWFWQPFGGTIWHIENSLARDIVYGIFAVGCLMVPAASMSISHFDLFGVRQVWLHFRGKPYTQLTFRTPGPYRYLRHPLYVGWFLIFWSTPDMTLAHLAIASGLTAYILVAIPYEERDLETYLGARYVAYRNRTPMFVPKLVAENSKRAQLEAEQSKTA